ncbi:hypothetical protein [Vibrio coralliilyticus]|uniref:hypothetical protein n=1 Tax=Vibrio coralliilyticus TaxID=190893 RepID=UPI001C268457|nr:hypothetical protein [Vibrio coralliilyticus]
MTEKILLNTPLYTFCRQLDTANITDLSLFTPYTKQVWQDKITLLRKQLTALPHLAGQVILRLPMGLESEEVDAVVLYRGIVFVIQLELESSDYKAGSIARVYQTTRQLKDLTPLNKELYMVPVLLAAKAKPQAGALAASQDLLFDTMCDSGEYLSALIEHFSNQFKADEIDAENWLAQHYRSL